MATIRPLADWTTPEDIATEVERLWLSGRILAARLDETELFPYALRLRKPDPAALTDRFDDVRKWIRTLEQGSKASRGYGYDIGWIDNNHRLFGRNRMPVRISLSTEQDAIGLIGKQPAAERFTALANGTLTRFPTLAGWLARHPMTVLAHAADWDPVISVLTWFAGHPHSGLYLRQLDIPGVHSKFIEVRRGLLAELLDAVLPPDAIDASFSGAAGFEPRYGLAVEPVLIRFRLLDPKQRIRGLSDLSIPVLEFARLQVPAGRVFITENKINGLAFPETPDSIVIFGLGNGITRLAAVPWLHERTIYYWGDIDTHGFAILDRLRAVFPGVQSFLMDRATLLAHHPLWVKEHEPFDNALTRLNDCEQALFQDIRRGDLADRIRLEQERIAFHWFTEVLRALPPPPL
jgi:hypothetical protein